MARLSQGTLAMAGTAPQYKQADSLGAIRSGVNNGLNMYGKVEHIKSQKQSRMNAEQRAVILKGEIEDRQAARDQKKALESFEAGIFQKARDEGIDLATDEGFENFQQLYIREASSSGIQGLGDQAIKMAEALNTGRIDKKEAQDAAKLRQVQLETAQTNANTAQLKAETAQTKAEKEEGKKVETAREITNPSTGQPDTLIIFEDGSTKFAGAGKEKKPVKPSRSEEKMMQGEVSRLFNDEYSDAADEFTVSQKQGIAKVSAKIYKAYVEEGMDELEAQETAAREAIDMYVKPADAPEGMIEGAMDAIGLRDKWVKRSPSEKTAPVSGAPAIGTEQGGYRFKGGDPASKSNWEKI